MQVYFEVIRIVTRARADLNLKCFSFNQQKRRCCAFRMVFLPNIFWKVHPIYCAKVHHLMIVVSIARLVLAIPLVLLVVFRQAFRDWLPVVSASLHTLQHNLILYESHYHTAIVFQWLKIAVMRHDFLATHQNLCLPRIRLSIADLPQKVPNHQRLHQAAIQ